ncbi:MAG: hypothetical protein Satyrvirus43_4 [Satyrvirus sp.]|uniref:NHL repeat containing protein n=1 Tax=Satyrvirus sp. TaxID=2487771 RepID=A0A3G5AF40_9VIRU|nr:MAG: hypothetical protein Satyrvirus43_4 [Satyrvirus sp.]
MDVLKSFRINKPCVVTVNKSNGNIVAANVYNDKYKIDIYSKEGELLNSFGTEIEVNVVIVVGGVAVDKDGNIYVSNGYNDTITKLSPNGEILLEIKNDQLSSPIGIALNSKNQIVVANAGSKTVIIFDKNGEFLFKFGEFDCPNNVVIDDNDKIYVSDLEKCRIQVFSSNGNYLFEFEKVQKINQGISSMAIMQNGNIIVGLIAVNNLMLLFSPDGKLLSYLRSNDETHKISLSIASCENGSIVSNCQNEYIKFFRIAKETW